ncbi:MAG: hypothetical protein ACRDTQ_00305 [Micromonosporaceae bacterium]
MRTRELPGGDTLITRVRANNPDANFRQMCKERYVPTNVLPLGERFDGHLVFAGDRRGKPRFGVDDAWVTCSPDQAQRWRVAADAYLQELANAYQELFAAHGARAELGVYLGLGAFTAAPRGLRLPGWRRRAAAHSAAAQQRFAARVTTALQRYQPVRDEIERRREQAFAAQREQQRHLEALRRELLDVARQRVWVYALTRDSTVHVWRADVPPEQPVPEAAERRDGPLTAQELEEALWQLRWDGAMRKIVWDPAACAEVERGCRERNVASSFENWWRQVTRHGWNIDKKLGDGHTTHISSYGSIGDASSGFSV